MRPVLLELQGFGAFRERTDIDFSDTDFFALVGPTGSGKSTILDAICFALYGNVPRYDDQRLVAAAMSLGANEAKVRLTFEVGGERYVAVRVVRRGAQNRVSTREARLERVGDGAILAGRESELRGAVEAVVGLSFEDFTRCVVLPQGEFARFLHDKPGDRQALLVRLLDLGVYGRLMNRANARAAEFQRELDRITGQLSELPTEDADGRAALDTRLVRLAELDAVVDAVEPELASVEADLRSRRETVERLAERAHALGAVVAPDWLAEHAARRDDVVRGLAGADEEVAAATAELDLAQHAVDAGPDLPQLERLLALGDRAAKGRAVVAERAGRRAEAAERSDRAGAELAAARAAHDAADAGLRDAEVAHRAHALAVTLRPGEPCPVCEQTVATLPLPTAPAALTGARAELDRTGVALRRAETEFERARSEAAEAELQWSTAAARLEEVEAELASAPSPDELRRRLADGEAAQTRLAQARARHREGIAAVTAARNELVRLDAAVAEESRAFHRQRDRVVALDPPEPDADLARAWHELTEWAARRLPDVAAEQADAERQVEAGREAARTLLAGLTEAVIRCGVDLPKPPTMAAIRTAVARDRARVEQAAAEVDRAVVRRGELQAAAERVGTERSVALELGRLLKTDRFQRWLVESAFHELAVQASTTLLRLSAGQFSLRVAPTGEFVVVDHLAADEERSVRTLSGGETFQASLALALALSDHVLGLSASRGQRALESIFLDEGFGTLDPESLETVASTIETLGADGRMVGIVTHVAELAERVPVRYRVAKGPRSATVVREVS